LGVPAKTASQHVENSLGQNHFSGSVPSEHVWRLEISKRLVADLNLPLIRQHLYDAHPLVV
jgi:hypothetical protein